MKDIRNFLAFPLYAASICCMVCGWIVLIPFVAIATLIGSIAEFIDVK